MGNEINPQEEYVPEPESVSRIFLALGDRKRWEVYAILLESEHPKTVSQLAELVGAAHIGNFGNQLKELEAVRLIRTTKSEGSRKVEAVKNETFQSVLRWLIEKSNTAE